jgi:hypothetical protein
MKLLYCPTCGDVFNLQRYLKSCRCGETKGLYKDRVNAEVNGKGISLAIGNGSLHAAIGNISDQVLGWRDKTKDPYAPHATSIICWARPHQSKANPHTVINKDL